MQIHSRLLGLTLLPALSLVSISAVAAGAPVRIATMPDGAEVTGLSTNAIGDVFLNAQHVGGKNEFKDDAPPALVGYMHGFDGSTVKESMAIPAEDKHNQVNLVHGEYVTFGKAGDKLGSGELLGGVYDVKGNLMYVSNAPDFNGFVPVGQTRRTSTPAGKALVERAWDL